MNNFGAVIPLYFVYLHEQSGVEVTLLKTTSHHEAAKCALDYPKEADESISIGHYQILQSGKIILTTREWVRK